MSDDKKTSNDPRVLVATEDVLSTLQADGKRRWMYPVLSTGAHFKQRFVVAWALIVFFIGLPIVEIKGKPAISWIWRIGNSRSLG